MADPATSAPLTKPLGERRGLRWAHFAVVWISLPAIVTVGVLYANGILTGDAALVTLAAVTIPSGVALWSFLKDLTVLADYARRSMAGAPPSQGVDHYGLPGDIAFAIQELRRSADSAAIEAQRERDALQRALDTLPDPLLTLDRARHVVQANGAATALLGRNTVGKDLAAGLRHPDVLRIADAVISHGEAHAETVLTLPGAAPRPYEVRAFAMAPLPGSEAVALVLLRDIAKQARLEAMRKDFVANVSHELRTPLTSLTGAVDALEGPARADAVAQAQFLTLIRTQVGRMTALVDDLLTLSRIEAQEPPDPSVLVDLRDVAAQALETLAPKAAARAVTLRLNTDDAPGSVPGDAGQLTQVIQNLVDNAIKYGPENAVVTIRFEQHGALVGVTVEDEGAPIPAALVPRLTERFYRAASADGQTTPRGTGLGLAIVKHILNRHGGSLRIHSGPHAGNRFTALLPRGSPALQIDTTAKV